MPSSNIMDITWADSLWPVHSIKPYYATMTLIGAFEDCVAVSVHDRTVRLSWSQLRDAAEIGFAVVGGTHDPELNKRYRLLLDEAEQHLRMSRLSRLSARGYSVGREEVGQRFASRGVIRSHSGRVILRGSDVPFGHDSTDSMLEMALHAGLIAREVRS